MPLVQVFLHLRDRRLRQAQCRRQLLRRRGKYHPEDFARLQLAEPFDLVGAKATWLAALDAAQSFARSRPPEESGCLYYAASRQQFVVPVAGAALAAAGIVPHFGAPGGVVPRPAEQGIEP